ncbi:MAG: tetratricopeptide repeat protein [Clostridia bacterium]|nr:tetratricopeptide repeat protein [Clostridia bacterium]
MNKKQQKIDLVKYWKYMFLGYMMLAFIILVHLMQLSEWWLVPAFFVYLIVSAIVCHNYVLGMIGNMYYFFRKPDKAKEFYTIAVKRNTRNVKALYNYALDALHEGRAEEALKVFQRAEKINTKVLFEKLIPLAISSCYWVIGDIDKAITTIEDLQTKFNYINPNTLTTLAYFYLLKKDFDKAEELTNKALSDNEAYAPAWDNLGQIYFSKRDNQKAKEYFEKALSCRESMTESLYYMGLISKAEGNTAKAKEYFEKANNGYISALSTVKREDIERELNKL